MHVATVLVIGLVLYFVPTIVAAVNRKRNTVAIAAMNFFLGWSVIGWIVALVWALTVDTQPTIVVR